MAEPRIIFKASQIGMTKRQAKDFFQEIFTAEEIGSLLVMAVAGIQVHKKASDSGDLTGVRAEMNDEAIEQGVSALVKITSPFGGELQKSVYDALGKKCGIYVNVMEDTEEDA